MPLSKPSQKEQIDAGTATEEILNFLVEEFLQSIWSKYFIMTSLKMVKARRKPKKSSMPHRIDTSVDAVNNWLLEVAHFVLDYHKDEFEHNLMHPNILKPLEFLRGKGIHTFQSISLEIFS
jgi:hypothetical protein